MKHNKNGASVPIGTPMSQDILSSFEQHEFHEEPAMPAKLCNVFI